MIIWGVSGASIASTVYVARRSWHVDVGIEVTDLAPPLAALADALPGARYLFFGFGDRHYLLAKKHNAPVLLAALWPGAGMMLVTGLSSSPEESFGGEDVISLELNAEQMRALQAFIWNTLYTRSGAPSAYAPGPYAGSGVLHGIHKILGAAHLQHLGCTSLASIGTAHPANRRGLCKPALVAGAASQTHAARAGRRPAVGRPAALRFTGRAVSFRPDRPPWLWSWAAR